MANIGLFDADLRPLAMYDPSMVPNGTFDYGLPFDHTFITQEPVATGITKYPIIGAGYFPAILLILIELFA